MKDVAVYLDDVLDCIAHIREYMKGKSVKQFDQDEKLQDAVVRRLEIIGEAIKRIPDGIKRDYPGIPWKKISGMRDILIHEYAGVSVQTVWKTVTEDLELLEQTMRKMKKRVL